MAESFSDRVSIPGGRVWIRKKEGVPEYYSEDKEFQILVWKDYCVLVSFVHEPLKGDISTFWKKRFKTIQEAMEHAEKM